MTNNTIMIIPTIKRGCKNDCIKIYSFYINASRPRPKIVLEILLIVLLLHDSHPSQYKFLIPSIEDD